MVGLFQNQNADWYQDNQVPIWVWGWWLLLSRFPKLQKNVYRFIPQILPTDMYIVCVPHSHHNVCLSWSSIMFIFPSSEYDVNKIIEYPGFTVPLPLGFIEVSFTLRPLFHSVFDFSVKWVAFFFSPISVFYLIST